MHSLNNNSNSDLNTKEMPNAVSLLKYDSCSLCKWK